MGIGKEKGNLTGVVESNNEPDEVVEDRRDKDVDSCSTSESEDTYRG